MQKFYIYFDKYQERFSSRTIFVGVYTDHDE